jgi:hypothetical protein
MFGYVAVDFPRAQGSFVRSLYIARLSLCVFGLFACCILIIDTSLLFFGFCCRWRVVVALAGVCLGLDPSGGIVWQTWPVAGDHGPPGSGCWFVALVAARVAHGLGPVRPVFAGSRLWHGLGMRCLWARWHCLALLCVLSCFDGGWLPIFHVSMGLAFVGRYQVVTVCACV